MKKKHGMPTFDDRDRVHYYTLEQWAAAWRLSRRTGVHPRELLDAAHEITVRRDRAN